MIIIKYNEPQLKIDVLGNVKMTWLMVHYLDRYITPHE